MAKGIEKALADLREEQVENEIISNGATMEFMDWLSPEEKEKFHAMEELAEQKRKWLKLFDRMHSEIANGDFSEALETFGLLSLEMELE